MINLRLILIIALMPAFFPETVTAGTLEAGDPRACHSPVTLSVQGIQEVQESMLEQACHSYEPSFEGMPRGNDPQCGEFGIDIDTRINSFSDALSIDCDVMRFYVVTEFAAQNPLHDLAQACKMRSAQLRLASRIPGQGAKIEARDAKLHRAEACAARIFKTQPAPIGPLVTPDARWSNFLNDQKVIQDSALSPQEESKALEALEAGDLEVEGRRNPVSIRGNLDAFSTVIAQEAAEGSLNPSPGSPVQWSGAFKRCVGSKFAPFTRFSKTLVVLAAGYGMELTPTGKEGALQAWMLTQADGSIEPAELFRRSYRLNGGDVYLSLLTIENLLSLAWQMPQRDRLEQTRKLRPIARMIGPGADTFGSWYHFFGTMLHGYVTNTGAALGVAQLEAVGSFGLSGKIEYQETQINRSGARVGGALSRLIRNGSWRTVSPSAELLEFSHSFPQDESLARGIRRSIRD